MRTTPAPRRPRPLLGPLVAGVLLAGSLTACTDTTPSTHAATPSPPTATPCDRPPPRAALEPDDGAWFGVSIDWAHDSLADYTARLGSAPAVVVTFAGLPLSGQDRADVDAAVQQARGTHSMLMLTLEPNDGLGRVTAGVAAELARLVAGYNDDGVPVFVRFAHEMNGSWYPWGQDPRAYVATFRRVAAAVHELAPGSAMLWAPNYGGGYPFLGGRYAARPGTAAAAALDTDHDGAVTGADDPYAPYWPGRESVDWVGMSLYHWGTRYPWGENEVPAPGKFVALLRGLHHGPGFDERGVPDFYRTYGERPGLPVAVTETAAFYAPGAGGAGALAIKEAWWRQALAPDLATTLPLLEMVNWFEWHKDEAEVGADVDWGVTRDPATRAPFRAALPAWLHFADDVPACR